MSLYNNLHGVNKQAALLLQVLDLAPIGKWDTGRFRDIHLNADGTEIILFTRNGGGNREHYNDDTEEGIGCDCTGCVISYHLPTHPNYLSDEDDDFDCTYASVRFSIPEEWKEFCKSIASGKEPESFESKFTKTMKEMESMTSEQLKADDRFKPLVKVIEKMAEGAK